MTKTKTKTETGKISNKISPLVLVLGLDFESFFFDLLASVGLLGNKNGCKGDH